MKINRLFLIAFAALFGMVLTACAATVGTTAEATAPQTEEAGGDGVPAPDLARVDEQGAVTVTVTPLNLDNLGQTLDFDVVLDTHSVELDMDLSALVTLTTNTGLSVSPTAWTGPSGGHHVEGTLSFPTTVDGTSLLDGASTLTLVIREVDAPERTFVWELGS